MKTATDVKAKRILVAEDDKDISQLISISKLMDIVKDFSFNKKKEVKQ